MLLSGVLGYCTSAYLLDLPLIPSLYIAVALTATSVAVPVAVWREAEALQSPNGELMLDVAELDDVSAILLMSLLFAAVPVLQAGANGVLLPTILTTGGVLLLKFLLFGAFCYIFSRFVEHRLTRFMERIEPAPDRMLMLVASGSVIAALAGLLGFSIALGAFFAGLIYSRDPEAVKVSQPFVVIYNLFTPFLLHRNRTARRSAVGDCGGCSRSRSACSCSAGKVHRDRCSRLPRHWLGPARFCSASA